MFASGCISTAAVEEYRRREANAKSASLPPAYVSPQQTAAEDRAERERLAREVADLKAREAQKEREQAEAAAAKERQERERLTAELAALKEQRKKAAEEAAPTLSATGQHWAIVIGVSEYADTRIPALRYAAKDAKAFYDWLIFPDGGRYAPSHVRFVVDKDATAKNIRDALFVWSRQALEEDMLTIYLACHGSPESPDTKENLFLLPYDADYGKIASTGFPMWDLQTALKRFVKAKRVVVIADVCHAQGVGEPFAIARRDVGGIAPSLVSKGMNNLSEATESVAVLTSTTGEQLAQESEKWGGGHGVFTFCLLNGLRGEADYNKDKEVSLGELIPFVSEQVRRATSNAQTPQVTGKFDPSVTLGR
jgi:uncharacterized caspase-like protein